MSEQNLEFRITALEALIKEREAFFTTRVQQHKPFGKVKVIYMKTKLLKLTHAGLIKKFNQQGKNPLTALQKDNTAKIAD